MNGSAARKKAQKSNETKRMSQEQLRMALETKKRCDAKALAIVERLLDADVDPSWLLDNLAYINRSHMDDVVEERAILKRCGYPLCDNLLTQKIDQRYHISTRSNKVYDVSRRKNFCSNRCYGAINFLLEQMLTSPLWSRAKDPIPRFQLLDRTSALRRAVPGDEVDLGVINVNVQAENVPGDKVESPEETSVDKVFENATANKSNPTETQDDFTVLDETVINGDSTALRSERNEEDHILKATQFPDNKYDQTVEPIDLPFENQDETYAIKAKRSTNEMTIHKEKVQEQHKDKRCRKKERKKGLEERSDSNNLVARVERCLKEWVTLDTLVLLLGEETVKRQKLDSAVLQEKYDKLCRKLNRLQVEELDRGDEAQVELQPLPDYSVLQEDSKKMEIKVRAFFEGRTVTDPFTGTGIKSEKDAEEASNVLPLVDVHAQKALRRRIILDRLDRVLPDLLKTLAGSDSLVWGDDNGRERGMAVKALINTFTLSASNIVFKPVEWNLLGLAIIKMLSLMESRLKFLLSTKQASAYIAMILMTYKLEPNYLDMLLISLTDITHLIDSENQCLSALDD